MKVAIHQPHFFPWMGYLNKMAQVEKFILMDEVQLTDKSNMFRNKFINKNGKEKFLTVCFVKKGYLNKRFKDIELNENIEWQKDHINFLKDTYRKSLYFNEIWELIEPIFLKDYHYLCDVSIDTVLLLRKIFNIPAEVILQSNLDYDKRAKKNELVISLCKSVKADIYLSGNGAKKYMDLDLFQNKGIKVFYQNFKYPQYKQINTNVFVPNLSSLDILFNCGVEGANKIFWNCLKNNK